jgi:hypothetical protein
VGLLRFGKIEEGGVVSSSLSCGWGRAVEDFAGDRASFFFADLDGEDLVVD